MKIDDNEQRELLIYAFRYTLGRASYAPHTVVRILKRNWAKISPHDKQLYKREIREAIELSKAGMPCDESAWKSLLSMEDE